MTERQWLGHRNWCPVQWGEPCGCSCSDVACPGLDCCADPDCSVAIAWQEANDD